MKKHFWTLIIYSIVCCILLKLKLRLTQKHTNRLLLLYHIVRIKLGDTFSKYYKVPVYSPSSLSVYAAIVALQGQQGASEQTVLLHGASHTFP